MRKYWLVVALLPLLIGAEPAAAQMSCPAVPPDRDSELEECATRPGPDLAARPGVDHQERCKSICEGDGRCSAWVYVVANRTCRLLGRAPTLPQRDNCCYTGIIR